MAQMRGHNIWFRWELRKIIIKYSLLSRALYSHADTKLPQFKYRYMLFFPFSYACKYRRPMCTYVPFTIHVFLQLQLSVEIITQLKFKKKDLSYLLFGCKYFCSVCVLSVKTCFHICSQEIHYVFVRKYARPNQGGWENLLLTLLHSERSKLYGVLAFLSAIGLIINLSLIWDVKKCQSKYKKAWNKAQYKKCPDLI